MLLFLTYHKTRLPDMTGPPDFYTVSQEKLLAQLGVLRSAGWQCLAPEVLLANSPLPAKGFILSFDDGTADHHNLVFPILRAEGLRAVFFVPTDKVGRPGYVTSPQLKEMAQAGQVIGLHSHEHKRLDALCDDELRDQVSRSKRILSEMTGITPWFFAPPGGFINEHVREVALGFGAKAIRTMRWGYNEQIDVTNLETVPINRYTDEEQFQKIIEQRQGRSLYFAKEAAKALVPARAYERLRGAVFKAAGRK